MPSSSSPFTWEKMMNMGEKTGMGSRSGHAAVMFGDKKIFVFGGFTGEIVLNDVWVFDVANS